MLVRFIVIPCLLAAVSACGGGGSATTDIAFNTAYRGDSGIADARQLIIRDSSAWSDLWAQHTSIWNPPKPLPVVDFNMNMVLAVFLGSRPSGCYSVDIQRVFQRGTDIYVEYRENVPPPGSVCAAYIATPSHIVTVPASTTNVLFVTN